MRISAIILGIVLTGNIAPGLWADAGFAQSLPVQEDFSARRVVVPQYRTGPRITVQIDPVEQARRLRPRSVPDPAAVTEAGAGAGVDAPPDGDRLAPKPAGGRYSWFWDTVPTAQGARAGRVSLAMARLRQGPEGSIIEGPRLQHLQDVASEYGIEILKATIGTKVSPALVLAVIATESAGRPNAVSSAGASGLMQLVPATAERFGAINAADPVENIKAGVSYLDSLMAQFDRDPLMVLAAYNAGEGAVVANDGVPPYPETRDYVPKVLAAWLIARELCVTPPELMTDPCVFKVLAAGRTSR